MMHGQSPQDLLACLARFYPSSGSPQGVRQTSGEPNFQRGPLSGYRSYDSPPSPGVYWPGPAGLYHATRQHVVSHSYASMSPQHIQNSNAGSNQLHSLYEHGPEESYPQEPASSCSGRLSANHSSESGYYFGVQPMATATTNGFNGLPSNIFWQRHEHSAPHTSMSMPLHPALMPSEQNVGRQSGVPGLAPMPFSNIQSSSNVEQPHFHPSSYVNHTDQIDVRHDRFAGIFPDRAVELPMITTDAATLLQLAPHTVERGQPGSVGSEGTVVMRREYQRNSISAKEATSAYRCQWDRNGSPCGMAISGDGRDIRTHLHGCHNVKKGQDGVDIKCLWPGCDSNIYKGSLSRHIREVHFKIKRRAGKKKRRKGAQMTSPPEPETSRLALL